MSLYIVMEVAGDNVTLTENWAADMVHEHGGGINSVWVQKERPQGDPVLQQAAARWINKRLAEKP